MKKYGFYFKYAWRSIWRGGRLSVFAIVCIGVGVATLIALQSLTVSIQETLVGDLHTRAGGDIVTEINGNSYYKNRSLGQAQTLLNTLKSDGQITDWTGLNSHNIQISGYFNVPPTLFTVDPAHFPLYGQVQMIEPVGGDFKQLLSQPNSIIISKSLWKKNDYKLGQEIEVSGVTDITQSGDNTAVVKIVGVVDPDIPGVNFDTGLFVGFGLTSQQTSRAFLTEDDVTPHVLYIRTAPGINVQSVIKQLQDFNLKNSPKAFPFFTLIRTAPEVLGEANRDLDLVQGILTYIGLIAILVGGLGVVNTMLVMVGRRTTEIATVKALGLKSRQTLTIFTLEVLMLGVIGSLLGLVLSIGLGFMIKSVVEGLFLRPLQWGLYPGPIITGLLVGIIASGLFGFLPAYAAGRVRPVVVLRQQNSNSLPNIGNLPTLLVILTMTLAGGGMAGLLLKNLGLGITIAFVTLLVSLLLIALMYGVIFLVGKSPAPFGPGFKMALRSFNRHRTRSATTLTVISVSLFFISLIGIVSDTIKTTLRQSFDYDLGFNAAAVNLYSNQDEQLQNSLQQTVVGLQRIFLSNEVAGFINNINGKPLNIDSALNNPICSGYIFDNRENAPTLKPFVQVSGRSLANGQSISPNGPRKLLAGRDFGPADMDKQVLLVNEQEATCYNIHVGDKVTLRLRSNNFSGTSRSTSSAPLPLEVIGIIGKGTAGTNFEKGFIAPYRLINNIGAQYSIFFMQIDRAHIKDALTTIQAQIYGNLVFDLTDLIDTFTQLLNQILAFPLLLSLLTLFSGSLLIANNVALAMLERRSEVGVLKAIGAKRRRVMTMLLWESVLLGGLGGIIGVGGSLLVAAQLPAIISGNINQVVNLRFAWSPMTVGLLIALGIGLALMATTLSAWRAVQEKPLVVLRYE